LNLNGYLFLDKAKFRASFEADVSEAKAVFLADSQVPWSVNALSGSISEPAWRAKPSRYLVATEDKMIPPLAQRQMATRAGDCRGGRRQPRNLYFEAGGGGGVHCQGGEERELQNGSRLTQPDSPPAFTLETGGISALSGLL
jgi:hypothetical protein